MSFRIDRVWAFISVGPDGEEGLIAQKIGGAWIPFVAGDERRLDELKAFVRRLEAPPLHGVKLVRFEQRIEVETIWPAGSLS
jgi:hypothetical protein